MAVAVIMPRQGQSVESCVISAWMKKPGDPVAVGDVLFSYETDKAAFEEEAKVAGTLLAVFFEEGDDVPCLTNVCVIGSPGEDVSSFRPDPDILAAASGGTRGAGGKEAEIPAVATVEVVKEGTAILPADGRIAVSPRARKMAGDTGVDMRRARPTGPNGRIIARDIGLLAAKGAKATPAAYEQMVNQPVRTDIRGTGLGGRITTADLAEPGETVADATVAAASAGAAAETFREVKFSTIRKVIARTMTQSLALTAQLTLHASFDATDILKVRAVFKNNGESRGLDKVTLNDMLLYTVSRTLKSHPSLNAHVLDDRLRLFDSVNLGMAVDTERGLMVPVLRRADTLTLKEISDLAKQMAADCQKGTVNPDLLQGATFTVTNLGTLGVESFTPVINPPQTGILGVNTILKRPREENGQIRLYPAMGLSLTFDHRALDGAPAARFLQDLKNNLENFTMLLFL